MNVSRDDHHALRMEMESHKSDTYKLIAESLNKQSDALNNLASKIEIMTTEFSYQKEATGRVSKEVSALSVVVVDLKSRFTVVETKQNVAVGIGGKFMMPLIFAMFFVSNALGIFIYLNK